MAAPTTRNTTGQPTEVGKPIRSFTIEHDNGDVHVARLHGARPSDGTWCITFTVNGALIRTFGYEDEATARRTFAGIASL